MSPSCSLTFCSLICVRHFDEYSSTAMITLFPGCVYIDAGQFKLILYLLATSIAIANTKSQKVPENGKK